MKSVKVAVIGGGAAGVGVGVTLKHFGFDDYVVLEKDEIGSSFLQWPEEMRMITPSFQANQFGIKDLNAVTLNTSPGFTLQTEHPTGPQYADYLKDVAAFHELPVAEGVDIQEIEKKDGKFVLEASDEVVKADYVIWACGEAQHPNKEAFPGARHCMHNIEADSWKEFSEGRGEAFVIGGYESGLDAAINLSRNGVEVTVIDGERPWARDHVDPSVSVSPYTMERFMQEADNGRIELLKEDVEEVRRTGDGYIVETECEEFISDSRPVAATGFKGSTSETDLFGHENGSPVLTEKDESTETEGLFLVGPELKHGEAIFCFIYKFRKRFPVVVEEIARREGRDVEEAVEKYREVGMYLDDLEECCEDICRC